MGFQNSTDVSNTIWAKLSQGKVVLSSKTPKDGYVERVNKVGNTTYELFFNSFTGKLLDVQLDTEGNYGPQWKVYFEDEGKTVIISLGYENRYTRTFLNRLLNKALDLEQPIEVKPYSFIPDGEEYTLTGCNIMQFGKKLNPRFDSKTELPQPDETIVKKKTTYNYSKQMDFLEQAIEKELRPRLKGAQKPDVSNGSPNIEDDFDLNLYGSLHNIK